MNTMIPRIHLIGLWSAIAFLVTLGLGLVVFAGFVPPPKPTALAGEIAALYQGNANGIRLGMILIIVASGLYLPWTVTLSAVVRRMEGESTFLSQCQLVGGVVASLSFFLPAVIYGVAAYRPDRNPDITLLLNDFGWLLFIVAPIPPFVVQFLPLAAAILLDKNEPAVFPRWFGFFTLWYVALFCPPMTGFFFKTGPFAWNGLLSFWLPVCCFGIWASTMLALMFKRIEPTHLEKEIDRTQG
jgi:hypothetical protein